MKLTDRPKPRQRPTGPWPGQRLLCTRPGSFIFKWWLYYFRVSTLSLLPTIVMQGKVNEVMNSLCVWEIIHSRVYKAFSHKHSFINFRYRNSFSEILWFYIHAHMYCIMVRIGYRMKAYMFTKMFLGLDFLRPTNLQDPIVPRPRWRPQRVEMYVSWFKESKHTHRSSFANITNVVPSLMYILIQRE